MKSIIKSAIITLVCITAIGSWHSIAADSGVELLKPWQQGGFQMMMLDPWVLAQRDSAIATLTSEDSAEKKNYLVVNVEVASKSGENWHLTLAHSGLKFKKGKTYQLAFSIKGSNATGLTVGIIQNHEPWMPISGGDPQIVTVTSSWQDCSFTFNISDDDSNGSLLFSNFNTKGATFSLANITLKEVQSK